MSIFKDKILMVTGGTGSFGNAVVKRFLEFDPSSSARNPTSCSRITGKGFGRCSYSIIKKSDVETYVQRLSEYERIFGFHPAYYEVKPCEGVHVVESFSK